MDVAFKPSSGGKNPDVTAGKHLQIGRILHEYFKIRKAFVKDVIITGNHKNVAITGRICKHLPIAAHNAKNQNRYTIQNGFHFSLCCHN